jgi:hypothetical protein
MIAPEEIQRRYDLWLQGYWEIPDNLDTTNFNFAWRPNSYDRPYIHQFGTQHQKTGGPKFIIPENEGIKYQDCQHAIRKPITDDRGWRPLIYNSTIDFSWHPDDTEPPYIYVFGNQWYDVDTMPTFQYRVKGATDKKYVYDFKAILTPDKSKWTIPEDIEDSFDYSWVPHPHEPPYIWQFGTQWQQTGGPAYVAENATYKKYIDCLKATKKANPDNRCWRPLKSNITFDYSWHPDENEPPYIYVFGNQWHNSERMPTVLYRVKGATEKKYTDMNATLLPVIENFEALIDNPLEFDYSWCPDPYDPPYTYVFGNQWHDSKIMPTLMYTMKGSLATKYVDNIQAKLLPCKDTWKIPEDVDVSDFDFSWVPNPKDPLLNYQFGTQWQKTGGPLYEMYGATNTKFVDFQSVIKLPNLRNWRILESIDKETFDFSWHPDDTEESYNYVFGSMFHSPEILPSVIYKNKTSVGNKFSTELKADLTIEKVDYEDSIFDAFVEGKFSSAYIHFGKKDIDYSSLTADKISVNLYGKDAVVPKNIKMYLYDKLTDYEHVIVHSVVDNIEPLDIVFISNGEACAEDNYKHLLKVANTHSNRIVRIDGVNGREASQHAAANASNTPWYFLINAKLKVKDDFDFNWQPNIYKSRRHYVFNATNPVNGLEYGHQAIVANNKKLTLNTVIRGLDFTLDSRTEVLDINSGVAVYNTSEWDTWRTAFRESIKLCYTKDEQSKERLKIWTSIGNGNYGHESIKGAIAGVEYFNSVDGDLNKLMLSYDWKWIKEYNGSRK